MYKVNNSNVLARLNISHIEHVIHYLRLTLMGKINSMASERNPRTFLNAWVASPRPIGCPQPNYPRVVSEITKLLPQS